jgi:class 3 adenylate cyclase/predicted ATPase
MQPPTLVVLCRLCCTILVCCSNRQGEVVSTIADWLRSLGMSEHADRFAENDIDIAVLRHLTDQDLKEIGVSLGHRRKLLAAIGDLSADIAVTPHPPAVTESKPQDAAERRQLTVMFCDLVGSTALSARLDPEDLRGIIGAYHHCTTEFVERNGGFVAKYMGDGVLAYFGYPRAHEHDAERAVRAGLAVVEEVPKLATAAGSPLQVRIGIATGLVVVGDLIGVGAAQERAVVGETPNLAARLQALAEPDTVVIGGDTRRLLGSLFEYRDLGKVPVKGFADPVHVWQVLGASTVDSRFEALRATTTSLVGRDEEIDLLMRRWEQAKRGEGCVVLISGEPGIGKSRIAETILERLNNEPHTRLRYFCSPYHQDSALYPIIAQLERAAGLRREDTAEQRLDKLEAVLAAATNDLRKVAPLLADLLSIPTGERYPSLDLTPQKRKEKTLLALMAQIEGLAARQPALMVFEDAHWIDPTTRESLDLLIDRMPSLRVLVIITYRPEFTPPWVGHPQVTLLSINRLPPRQRAEMITCMTGGKALPKEIADQIIDRTDGVPLFIEELTKAVVESGVLTDAGDRYTVAGPLPALGIPTSLNASLLARLDRLAPTREVAQIGAALGRQFSHELISAVALMPQHQLDDALAHLVSAEMIFRRGIPPNAEYTFKHALVQDAAYSTLLRSRRQQIHARITTALEDQFADIVAAQPALLAHHCTEAGLAVKAVGYRMKACYQAMARSAMTEAEGHLRKGLDLLSNLPDETERQQHELDLQMSLGMVMMATQGYAAPAATKIFARARRLCEQLDQSSKLALILVGQCGHHTISGEIALACLESKEIVDLGEARNDADVKFQGYAVGTSAWFHAGDFVTTRSYAERALAHFDPAHPSLSWWPQDPQIMASTFLFRSLIYLGHLDQARQYRDETLANARQRGHSHTLAMVLEISLLINLHMQCDPAHLLTDAEELRTLSAEHGFPYWEALASWNRGQSLLALGRVRQALEVLTEALTGYRGTGAVTVVPAIRTSLAEALGKADRFAEGLEQLDETARQIEATEERWTEADMLRVRGELLINAGNPVEAETSFHQAVAVARRQSAKLWEIRSAASLARLWRDQGKHIEAHDLLTPIYGWFKEGHDTPVLQEAKALLETLTA